MGSPYSEDLRLRVLAAVDSGMSKMAVHKTFGISRSTIDDWLQLRATQGHVHANTTYRRGPAPKISDLVAFTDFAQRHPHATLEQMTQAWQGETEQAVSLMPLSKALRRIAWTRKKRVTATANDAQPNGKHSSLS